MLSEMDISSIVPLFVFGFYTLIYWKFCYSKPVFTPWKNIASRMKNIYCQLCPLDFLHVVHSDASIKIGFQFLSEFVLLFFFFKKIKFCYLKKPLVGKRLLCKYSDMNLGFVNNLPV